MKTILYIARHGETQWNKIQRFQGRFDSHLTELGKQQSIQIAQQVLDKKIDIIFSSDLGRAKHSAEICKSLLNVEVKLGKNLTERHLGNWQGKQIEAFKHDTNYIELLYKFTELTPKGGESAISCGQRIYNALEEIAQVYASQTILVIFHGEALRCFLALLGEHSDHNAYDLFKNGCVTSLTYEHNTESFNLT